jgi:hypothetical protein
MSFTKKTASTLSPEIRSLLKAKQEANEAFYAELRTFLPDKDLHQTLFLVVNGVVSKLVALSYAHTSTSPRPEWILKGFTKPEWILKGFSELGQLLTTPIRDDYRLMQHLPVALQLDNSKRAACPFRQAVAELLTLACKSEDKKETATARREARQQLTVDIADYLQDGVAEEIGADLLAVARTFPTGKERLEEEPAAEKPESHPSPSAVLTNEDKTILVVLFKAGRSLRYFEICQESAKLVRNKSGNSATKASGFVSLSESTIRQRVLVLGNQNLVARPPGANGKLTKRKGVGITKQGRTLVTNNFSGAG